MRDEREIAQATEWCRRHGITLRVSPKGHLWVFERVRTGNRSYIAEWWPEDGWMAFDGKTKPRRRIAVNTFEQVKGTLVERWGVQDV